MNDKDMMDKLHEQTLVKARLKILNTELAKIAVNELGIPQEHLGKVDAKAIIKGYLIGRGLNYIE